MNTYFQYTLDTKKLHKLGANWLNIVMDIDELMKSKGFKYSRTLGYEKRGTLPKEEILQLSAEIMEIGLGPKYFIVCNLYTGSTTSIEF